MNIIIAIAKPKGKSTMPRSGPANPGDPMRKARGDGTKGAFAQKAGTERGRPGKGKQPGMKSDGMKVAMRGEASKKGSKLSPMGGAEKRVR